MRCPWEMRGPLEVLHDSWVENEVQFSSSIEWINELRLWNKGLKLDRWYYSILLS